MTRRKTRRTKTSTFGTPGRVSHDSSDFYESRMYEHLAADTAASGEEVILSADRTNCLYGKSSESMEELPDRSVHLMITSPPYNARKDYDEDLTLDEYLDLLHRVFQETMRVLVPGGRACINIANLGRKPYIPLHAYIIQDMERMGFLMRGEIIWDKAASASPSTAWGSWLSAANPVLRDVHEYILVFSKGTFSRKGEERESTIERDDFLAWTKSIWTFPAVSARQIGHPAPFPLELPRRLIQMYSFKDDVVLDPFCGSGTTCVAAMLSNRRYVGYDLNTEYIDLARKRLDEAEQTMEEGTA